MDECKPLLEGNMLMQRFAEGDPEAQYTVGTGRGLHSFTFQLNLSRFCHCHRVTPPSVSHK